MTSNLYSKKEIDDAMNKAENGTGMKEAWYCEAIAKMLYNQQFGGRKHPRKK